MDVATLACVRWYNWGQIDTQHTEKWSTVYAHKYIIVEDAHTYAYTQSVSLLDWDEIHVCGCVRAFLRQWRREKKKNNSLKKTDAFERTSKTNTHSHNHTHAWWLILCLYVRIACASVCVLPSIVAASLFGFDLIESICMCVSYRGWVWLWFDDCFSCSQQHQLNSKAFRFIFSGLSLPLTHLAVNFGFTANALHRNEEWIYNSIYKISLLSFSLCVWHERKSSFFIIFFRDQLSLTSRQTDKSETQKIDKNNNGNQTVGP